MYPPSAWEQSQPESHKLLKGLDGWVLFTGRLHAHPTKTKRNTGSEHTPFSVILNYSSNDTSSVLPVMSGLLKEHTHEGQNQYHNFTGI